MHSQGREYRFLIIMEPDDARIKGRRMSWGKPVGFAAPRPLAVTVPIVAVRTSFRIGRGDDEKFATRPRRRIGGPAVEAFTLGQFCGKEGRPYIGTRPSRKAVKSLLKRIHDRTTKRWYADTPENTVAVLSHLLRGWCGYFDQGPVIETYNSIREYLDRRLRHWLVRRTGDHGRGFERFTQEYVHDTLGLYRIPRRRADLPRAKV